VNPRSVIRQAATRVDDSQTELTQAVADAYGILPIGEIAEAAGVTRPTVYRLLRDAGVQLKGANKT
jgi:DNA-binding MurR/RpiR family transcriptional regulator